MPPKEKKPHKPFTLESLESAAKEVAVAAQKLATCERQFDEGDRTQESFERIQSLKIEHAFYVRVMDLASAEHDAYNAAEADRVAAEAEAQRLEAIKICDDEFAKLVSASCLAAEALAKGLATSWQIAIRRQRLGGNGHNHFAHIVGDAAGRALVAEGFPYAAIEVH